MAINQNHLFEELNGVKCAIAEKNASKERIDFLKRILEYNHYTVVVAASPPPKIAPQSGIKPAIAAIAEAVTDVAKAVFGATPTPAREEPETFTIGVTDVTFNPTNAIFGRLLKAPGSHVVTLAYWHQKENQPRDDVPYFDTKI